VPGIYPRALELEVYHLSRSQVKCQWGRWRRALRGTLDHGGVVDARSLCSGNVVAHEHSGSLHDTPCRRKYTRRYPRSWTLPLTAVSALSSPVGTCLVPSGLVRLGRHGNERPSGSKAANALAAMEETSQYQAEVASDAAAAAELAAAAAVMVAEEASQAAFKKSPVSRS